MASLVSFLDFFNWRGMMISRRMISKLTLTLALTTGGSIRDGSIRIGNGVNAPKGKEEKETKFIMN